MKITSKQYAMLLYELTKDTQDVQEATKDFLRLLLKNRALSLLPKIRLLYNDYYNQQEDVTDVEIITARKISEKVFQGDNLNVQMKIEPRVIGGACIKAGDYLVDNTLKSRLTKLKQVLK